MLKDFINKQCIYVADPNIQYADDLERGRLPERGYGTVGMSGIFLLRNLLYNPPMMEYVLDHLEEFFPDYAFQIAGPETGSVPFLMALQARLWRSGRCVNVFSVRPSRKEYGINQLVNGMVQPNVPVLWADDLVNSGSSVGNATHTVEVEFGNLAVPDGVCIVGTEKETQVGNITMHAIFTKDEFDNALSELETPKDIERQ